MTFTQGHRLLISIVSAALLSGCGGAGGSSVAPPLSPANESPVSNNSLDTFAHVDLAGGRDVYISSFNGQPGVDVFAPGATKPTRVIAYGAMEMTAMPDGTLYASDEHGVDEYAPGGSSPINVISDYNFGGFGIAVGPAK